jgi:hypothetical protein
MRENKGENDEKRLLCFSSTARALFVFLLEDQIMHGSPLVVLAQPFGLFDLPLVLGAQAFNFDDWLFRSIVGGVIGAILGLIVWIFQQAAGGQRSSTVDYDQWRSERKPKVKRIKHRRRPRDEDEEDADLENSSKGSPWTLFVIVGLVGAGALFLLLISGCVVIALLWNSRPSPSAPNQANVASNSLGAITGPSSSGVSTVPNSFAMNLGANSSAMNSGANSSAKSTPSRLDLPPGPVAPIAARFEKSEVALPGAVADVAVGGAGKYLVLHLAAQERMAVFDVNQAKVIHELPLPAGKVHVVAGLSHAVVVAPKAGAIELWNLASGTKEATPLVPLLAEDEILGIGMGSASAVPLVVSQRKLKRTLSIDLASGAVTELHWTNWRPNNAWGPAELSCTPDGSIVIGWGGGWSGMETITMRQGRQVANSDKFEFYGDFALPSADGVRLFTPQAVVNLRDLSARKIELLKNAYQVPARDADYFVALYSGRWKSETARKDTPICQLVFCREDAKPVFTLEEGEWQNVTGLPWEKCVHYYPGLKLLVCLDKERLVLRRFG